MPASDGDNEDLQNDADDEALRPSSHDFPTYVRWLAVAHVLSLIGGPLGFVLLMAAAMALFVIRKQGFDVPVVCLGLSALACPALCAAYRKWFENWGRRHWPE